jgi:5'-deoxynucleotidase
MRNTRIENIQEHSLQVAMIAHGLAVIKNTMFDGNIDPDRIATLAIYHEVSEVITGDLATPIKYFNPDIKKAYSEIEVVAKRKLFHMLPEELQEQYNELLFPEEDINWRYVKIADKICAYIKCIEEINAGNKEFVKAESKIRAEIDSYRLPEVDYFMERFMPSFALALDELN